MTPDGESGPLRNSMTLLTEVMEHPLDQGYADAKARAHRHRKPRRISIALRVIIAVIVGVAITAAVLDLRAPRPAATQARAMLGEEITMKRELANALKSTNDQLRTDIEELSTRLVYGDGADAAKPTAADAIAVASAAVTGPGIVVTLSDGSTGLDMESARVQDTDLQLVVNELWEAGAEAIAINGIRLGPQSAIRGAGGAVLVDFVAVISPFEIIAIGSSNDLQVDLARSQTADHLSRLNATYGITFKVISKSSLEIPGDPVQSLQVADVPVGEFSVGSTLDDAPAGVK